MTRPRFSLRALLILTALLAAFCFWRDRPRQMANRFIALIEAGDYRAAEAMFGGENVGLTNPAISGWTATRNSQSAADWLRGRCTVNVAGKANGYDFWFSAAANATGMQREDK